MIRRLGRSLLGVATILAVCAAWCMALGMWLIAPSLVDAHRIALETLAQWLVLAGTIVAMSAVIGAELSAVAAVLLVPALLVSRRRGASAWAPMLFVGPALATAYFVAAAIVEWWVARRTPLVQAYAYVAPAIGIAALLVLTILAHRVLRARAARVSALLATLAMVTLLGAVALPWRVTTRPRITASDAGPLVPAPDRSRAGAPPVLLVGIDSGNWQTLEPAVRAGSLPTFARLIDGGVHGEVEALWPPFWSGPAWSAILTGHPQKETGVYGDLTGVAPGLPPFDVPLQSSVLLNPYLLVEWKLLDFGAMRVAPTPRTVLGRPPVWELLSRAGVPSGVVRFDFTYPPAGQAEVVVSNHAGRDIWSLANVTVGTDLIAPPELAPQLGAPFSERVPFDAEGFARVLTPADRPRTTRVQFELDAIRSAYDIDKRTVEAALAALHARPDLRFLGVYLGGFDNICHAMWQYRFPEEYGADPPPPADVTEFRGVIDRYLEFLDASVARLAATFPTTPNVIVVSDHGHGPSLEGLDQPIWRGWHGKIGIFVAQGPSVPAVAERQHVSYFDVVPTIMDLLGFAVPSGMHGVSVRSDRGA